MPSAAQSIELAVRKALANGFRTPDIHRGEPRYKKVGTKEMVENIVSELYVLEDAIKSGGSGYAIAR